jgi:List-Bact-rpt repeat protein
VRTLNLGCLALLIASGCGSGSPSPADGGSGGGGRTQINLTISTSGNGLVRGAGADCRGNCTAQYTAGSQVHLVAVADPGSSFVGWTGACSGAGGCDLTLDANRDVSATFAVAPPPPVGNHRLTVVVQGNGRVTSSPAGLDCGSSRCSANFPDGTPVTLTAAASSGYRFDGWGTDCSGSGDCKITISRDATVFANFVAQQPPPPAQAHLTVSTTGSGTVTGGSLSCGESSPICDVMVATGSQVTLTASPASGARFAGWGGACSGTSTTCQLTVQSDTKVTAEFQPEVIVLAPNDGNNTPQLAINSTRLFWGRYASDSHTNGMRIWAIPKAGGAAVHMADGSPDAMVADDGFLYWTDTMFLYSVPVGGGEASLLHTEPLLSIGQLALDETGALYYGTARGLGNNGAVHRMQNRVDTVLVGGQNVGSIAVDATHVYYVDASLGIPSLRRVPRNGGAAETIYSCGNACSMGALAVDSANVYFRSASAGQVQALSKSDFSVRTLSGAGAVGAAQGTLGIALNASVVYWNWLGGAPYGIFSANADGTGLTPLDTSNDSNWGGPRVDDTALYYFHDGAIIRRLK